jgi:hypothetical protein
MKKISYLFAKKLYMAHLPTQDVVIELCSDGLSAGDLPKTLAELLKSVGCNHAPFYLGTWAQSSTVNRMLCAGGSV